MKTTKVLFICTKNSARSRIAEAFCSSLSEGSIHAESAGLEPGEVNALASAVMADIGIDITAKASQDVFELYRQGRLFSHIITVCDASSAAQCPLFPGNVQRETWDIPDIATLEGTEHEKHLSAAKIRDQIKARVQDFVKTQRHLI